MGYHRPVSAFNPGNKVNILNEFIMIIAILESNEAVRKLVGDYIYEWYPTADVYLVSGEAELKSLCRDLKPDYIIGCDDNPILKPVLSKKLKEVFEPVTTSDLN